MSVPGRTLKGMGTYDSTNARNAEAARVAGWPDLTGSERQIPWGITARADKVREMEATGMTAAEKARWRAVMLRETRAGAWIDYRGQPWPVAALAHLTEAKLDALHGA